MFHILFEFVTFNPTLQHAIPLGKIFIGFLYHPLTPCPSSEKFVARTVRDLVFERRSRGRPPIYLQSKYASSPLSKEILHTLMIDLTGLSIPVLKFRCGLSHMTLEPI